MPLQFLVGGSVSVINIMIHALITLVAIGIARRAGLQRTSAALAPDDRDGRHCVGTYDRAYG